MSSQSELYRRLGRLEVRLEALKEALDGPDEYRARQAISAMMDELAPMQVILLELPVAYEAAPPADGKCKDWSGNVMDYVTPAPDTIVGYGFCAKCGAVRTNSAQPAGYTMPLCETCIKGDLGDGRLDI